jgi:hypothetical protein
LSVGKLTVIAQFATHWPAAANDSAAARIRFGKDDRSPRHSERDHEEVRGDQGDGSFEIAELRNSVDDGRRTEDVGHHS